MAEALPRKFTDAERYAYDWLRACGIRGWAVDFVTKEVHSVDPDATFPGLVEFAKHHGLGG